METTGPVGNEDISWAVVITREKSSALTGGGEVGTCCSVVKCISEVVVPGYSLPLRATGDGVVTKTIT